MQTVLARDPAAAYLDTIAATFESLLRDDVPRLREPIAADADRAIKIVGLVVETIAGFAHGVVAGELGHIARTWVGAEVSAAWLAATRSADDHERVSLGIEQLYGWAAPPVRAVVDARPLVDELGARLQPRLRRTAGVLGRLVADFVARTPLADRVAMFAHLRATSLLAERLREELATGWACACAAIAGEPQPHIQGSARSRALWQAWSRLARLEHTVHDTYIVRVHG